jgi:hypothetical protein
VNNSKVNLFLDLRGLWVHLDLLVKVLLDPLVLLGVMDKIV